MSESIEYACHENARPISYRLENKNLVSVVNVGVKWSFMHTVYHFFHSNFTQYKVIYCTSFFTKAARVERTFLIRSATTARG